MSDSDFRPSESESEKDKEESISEKLDTSLRKKSKAWEFFDKVPNSNKMARCRICQQQFSYKATVSNLPKHVLAKHKGAWQKSQNGGYTPEIPELIHFAQNSSLDVVSCRLCNKSICSIRATLRKHLMSHHPEVPLDKRAVDDEQQNVIISGDGQLFEIQTTEDEPDAQNIDALDMDVVYFDEYNKEIKQETVNLKTRKRKITKSPEPKPVTEYIHIEEQMQSTNTSSKLGSLDLFCSYLISLMKELPDKKCKRLQAEFVFATIKAQLDSKNEE